MSEWCLSLFLAPSQSSNTFFYPQSVSKPKSVLNFLVFCCFQFGLTFESIQELGGASVVLPIGKMVEVSTTDHNLINQWTAWEYHFASPSTFPFFLLAVVISGRSFVQGASELLLFLPQPTNRGIELLPPPPHNPNREPLPTDRDRRSTRERCFVAAVLCDFLASS